MAEWVTVGPHTRYLDCPTKVGLVFEGETAYAIDAGSDKDAAKKVLREVGERRLAAVYHTHSHADHIGGSALLGARTGCAIYAPDIEWAFTRFPILEPWGLYGGKPPRELHHKFLLAKESEAQPLGALPAGWEAIPLPGHSPAMTGYRTPDDVVFLGDCLSSPATLEKYPIGYLYDVEQYITTLERVKTLSAALFVPAHAAPTDDIAPLAQQNIEAVWAVAQQIESFCAEPIGFDALLARLFAHYGLTMNAQQHALVGSTVRSYLTYLTDIGRLCMSFTENVQRWQPNR